ncbi:DgyrCDS6644 [Dimorphilus gyrociliatus]|uniref:Alanine--glyoxylate aminotransferase 2, mitochondrial n=1 Tax=Dimorphilus gyrociliatus TaxID=2664684 RepID=A0A7I8VNP5_9ANNE|nr:DgyrCDS6644 [Dimorphilus gyrociliatus]
MQKIVEFRITLFLIDFYSLIRSNYLGRHVCRYLSATPEMPSCDFKPTPYKGKPKSEITKIRGENLTPALLTYYKNHILINQGYMQWLFDEEGRRFLDLFGGIVTVSVGHCHPKVVQALDEQNRLLWHTTNIYLHPKIHEYAEKLISKFPADSNLKVVYFVNSGSDANDLAVLMARMYTKRFDIISLRNAYHGASPYLMGLTSLSSWRYQVPSGFGMHQAVNPDVYKGPWGGSNCRDSPVQTDRQCDCSSGSCEAGDNYVEQLEDLIRHSCPKEGIAAFFAESIQGVGGTVQFPKNYLSRAFDLVRSKGGVCISDEVQTGFGRTGTHYWNFQGHGVTPDIVTMAKGIGNGFPLAAVVTTPEIAATMGKALHFNTYGGNPLSCAVGSSVLDVIEEDNCQQISHDIGTHLLEELSKLRDQFDYVGDVRGKGLMIGVELVADKKTKKPLDAEKVTKIWEDCKDMGVLIGKGGLHGNVLRIKPPMCITKEDADFSIAVLRKSLEANL